MTATPKQTALRELSRVARSTTRAQGKATALETTRASMALAVQVEHSATYDELAAAMGVSRHRVSQILAAQRQKS